MSIASLPSLVASRGSAPPADDVRSRPRVLILAYTIDPETSMEARLGWNRALQAAKTCNTWVLTSDNDNCERTAQGIRAAGVGQSLRVVRVPETACERWLSRSTKYLLYYQGYQHWQWRAYRAAQELHEKVGFDLIHLVTCCGYRQPGYAWKFDVPFIFGPVGGTQNTPWRFLSSVDLAGALREAVRSVVNNLQLRFSRKVRDACRNSAVVIAANSTGQRDLQRTQGVLVVRQLETGIMPLATSPHSVRRADQPLRILWTGRLEAWKALPLLLRALAQLPSNIPYELRVLGAGSRRRRWEALAGRLGVAPHVQWLGWCDYSKTLPHYQWADVFAFTSLRDTSGSGLLEALAAGVPIIGVNHQGAADIMTDRCAVRIPVTRPAATIAAFRDAIQELSLDAERLQELSAGAVSRAAEFHWDRQGARMDRIYRLVLRGEEQTSRHRNHAGTLRNPG